MNGRGVVREFDEAVGLGVVAGDDGVDHGFHCVEIADGSRTIAPGTVVRYELLRKLGLVEAAGLAPET